MKTNGTNGNGADHGTSLHQVVMLSPERELADKRHTIVVLHGMLEEARAENAELTKSLAASKAQVEKLKDELETGVAARTLISEGLLRVTAERTELQSKVADLETKLTTAVGIAERLRDRYKKYFVLAENLQTALAASEVKNQELRVELNSAAKDAIRYHRIPRLIRVTVRVLNRIRRAGDNVFAPLKEA